MHEHLDAFGIINMNERVYDPLTAMFFSPDPFVQAPGNWLNFNGYAYCYGNPFKYTDPDGEFIVSAIIVGAMVGGFFGGMQADRAGGSYWGGFLKGALIGGLSGAAGGGAGQLIAGVLTPATTLGGAIGNGALIGATGGFAGGFVGGSGNAWINGAGLGEGLKAGLINGGIGALAGGIIGGISGGIQFNKQNLIFQKGLAELGVNAGDPVSPTDALLNKAQKVWYPDAPMDKVRAFTVENVPSSIQAKMDAVGSGASTSAMSIEGKLTGFSKVFFNKNLAFSSAKRLFFAMGHEFVHVSQYAALAGEASSILKNMDFIDMLDFHAYSYEYSLGSPNYGGFTSADALKFSNSSFSNWYHDLHYMKFPWTSNYSFRFPF